MTISEGHSAPRITIISLHFSPEPTGSAPYIAALARGLVDRGFQVRVVTSRPHYPAWRVMPGHRYVRRREDRDGVEVLRLWHYVPSRPTPLRRVLSEASFGLHALLVPWGRPDVMLTTSPGLISSRLVLLRASLRRIPALLWVHDLYTAGLTETGTAGRRAAGLMGRLEAGTLRTARAVAVAHERLAASLSLELSVPAEKIRVLPNWTHLTGPPAEDRAGIRARYGWGEETVVLHAGNMGVKQGLENVVDAAAAADRSGASVRFVLLGDGNRRAELVSRGRGLDRLQFLAPVQEEEFRSVLAAADVLLVNERPGVAEMSVPSKLTSYFDAGLPVLAATGPEGATADEIGASGAGIRVDPGLPDELVGAAMRLRNDPEQAAALGVAGRRHREAWLSERSAIDRFDEWIRSCLR